MKWLCGFAGLALLLFPLFAAEDLAKVHTVYLLQMSHGLDQYLANQITNEAPPQTDKMYCVERGA